MNGYSGDKHSKESKECLAVLQREWSLMGKEINIQHARSCNGDKIVIYQGKSKPVSWVDILSMMERNMHVNTMDVISIVVQDVFH